MTDLLKTAALNAELAQMIYAARTRAGLTQKQLADRIGTQQSVISRLEDADYEGHPQHPRIFPNPIAQTRRLGIAVTRLYLSSS